MKKTHVKAHRRNGKLVAAYDRIVTRSRLAPSLHPFLQRIIPSPVASGDMAMSNIFPAYVYSKEVDYTEQQIHDSFSENVLRVAKKQKGKSWLEKGQKAQQKMRSTQTIPIGQLIPTQAFLYKRKVDKYVKTKGSLPSIDVLKKDGKYYIRDGHHKVASAHINGKSSVSATVYDLDTPA